MSQRIAKKIKKLTVSAKLHGLKDFKDCHCHWAVFDLIAAFCFQCNSRMVRLNAIIIVIRTKTHLDAPRRTKTHQYTKTHPEAPRRTKMPLSVYGERILFYQRICKEQNGVLSLRHQE
jgi:hypothetical protein